MSFAPVEVHECLDHRGLLADSRDPGTYALEVDVPSSRHRALEQWRAHFDVCPADNAIGRLANADRVAYVGASTDVYARLMDHANAEVRKAALLEAFDATDVVGVWPAEKPFDAEYLRAIELSRDSWTVWCNGEVVG